ncbi:Hypothetical_protein [Hexamita inflata]|uniref:Hypothetical_protein n=1 Tax=Hexamita inflata TaxID=28002 RepID=A0AA86U5R3_9EUKA|nr:Hypothetical protein HINF_LOCUS28066 [Hexamita inflata]
MFIKQRAKSRNTGKRVEFLDQSFNQQIAVYSPSKMKQLVPQPLQPIRSAPASSFNQQLQHKAVTNIDKAQEITRMDETTFHNYQSLIRGVNCTAKVIENKRQSILDAIQQRERTITNFSALLTDQLYQAEQQLNQFELLQAKQALTQSSPQLQMLAIQFQTQIQNFYSQVSMNIFKLEIHEKSARIISRSLPELSPLNENEFIQTLKQKIDPLKVQAQVDKLKRMEPKFKQNEHRKINFHRVDLQSVLKYMGGEIHQIDIVGFVKELNNLQKQTEAAMHKCAEITTDLHETNALRVKPFDDSKLTEMKQQLQKLKEMNKNYDKMNKFSCPELTLTQCLMKENVEMAIYGQKNLMSFQVKSEIFQRQIDALRICLNNMISSMGIGIQSTVSRLNLRMNNIHQRMQRYKTNKADLFQRCKSYLANQQCRALQQQNHGEQESNLHQRTRKEAKVDQNQILKSNLKRKIVVEKKQTIKQIEDLANNTIVGVEDGDFYVD